MKLTVLLLILISYQLVFARIGFGPGEQEWDFAEVRPGAFMFWWLYYTTANVTKPEDRPLVIWLQGGPGVSGTGYGNFKELGPLTSDLKPRNTTWVNYYNVLFIDNPVGVGFGHVNDSGLLVTNNTIIAQDLVKCLVLFHEKLKYQFKNTPVIIAAESYGGKMAVQLVLELEKELQTNPQLNLKGVVLIDSGISTMHNALKIAPYAYSMGLIDIEGFNKINQIANTCKQLYDQKQFLLAKYCWETELNEFSKYSKDVDVYNILAKKQVNGANKSKLKKLFRDLSDIDDEDLPPLMNGKVREALGISQDIEWVSLNSAVYSKLEEDFITPVTAVVEELFNTTNVKIYVVSGQLDLILNTPGTYQWAIELNFIDKQGWMAASRDALVVNGYIEGYVKKYKNFGFYWVDRSGHMVPHDNDMAMLKILNELLSS